MSALEVVVLKEHSRVCTYYRKEEARNEDFICL